MYPEEDDDKRARDDKSFCEALTGDVEFSLALNCGLCVDDDVTSSEETDVTAGRSPAENVEDLCAAVLLDPELLGLSITADDLPRLVSPISLDIEALGLSVTDDDLSRFV